MRPDLSRKRASSSSNVRRTENLRGEQGHPEEDDPIQSVERVLALSDEDFEKWLDTVIRAGLMSHR